MTKIVVTDLATAQGRQLLEEACSGVDVGLLIASAGFGSSGAFLESNLSVELEMIEVNCGALMAQCRFFGRRFVERKRGGIILAASLVGFQGVPFAANYAATKAYVQSLAEALHLELRRFGVDVIASAPGPVHSGFAARAKMTMNVAIDPDVVARASLRALGRTSVVTPGALSKLLTYSLAPLPRALRSRIMARVMYSMARR